jgi:hypothetical protein
MSVRVLAAEFARVVLDTRPSEIKEGAGNAACWPQPMARQQQKKLAAVTKGSADQPAFPAQWF